MSELKNLIIETFDFSISEYESIQEFFEPLSLKKGEYFLEAGQYSKRLGFVESGLVREFLFVNDKEITKWLATKGHFTVDLNSFLNRVPARVSLQALQDTNLVILSKENYDNLGNYVPRWHELEKLFLSKCFGVIEDRVIAHLALDSEDRYRQYLASNPSMINDLPLNYLASMLGMTPETLSRVRSKLSRHS